MRRIASSVLLAFISSSIATPQGRPLDWPSYGGDARRTGWERSDTRITKDNVKDFQLVLKRQLESPEGGPRSLTAPVVIGLLISYRGFKELGFVSNSVGDLWSIDVDLNRVFWKKRYEGAEKATIAKSGPCSGLAVFPALTPPLIFGRRRPGGTNSPSPGLPPTTAGRTTERPTAARVVGSGFGAPRPIFLVSNDGKLRQINTSDGSDQFPPLNFLPAGSKPGVLTLNENVMYTTTNNCGGKQPAVWAIDLADEAAPVTSFPLSGGSASGIAGFAIGNDGTVFVQTGTGPSDPTANKFSNTLVALSPKDLQLKGYFTPPGSESASKATSDLNSVTPVVFEFQGRDMVASAGHDGRIYIHDAAAIGGNDKKTALAQAGPVAASNGGIWGGLSSWEDADGTRWLAAPVWGPLSADFKISGSNGPTPNGSVVAFKVEEQGGKVVLTPAWTSRDLSSPVPPVITSGIVFALSTGGYNRQGSDLKPRGGARATLYALDATTGKEMYSTGTQVTAPANLTGLAVANGRVFFTTADGLLYGFGVYMEI